MKSLKEKKSILLLIKIEMFVNGIPHLIPINMISDTNKKNIGTLYVCVCVWCVLSSGREVTLMEPFEKEKKRKIGVDEIFFFVVFWIMNCFYPRMQLFIADVHVSRTDDNVPKKKWIFYTYGLILNPEKCSGFVKLIWMKPNCMSLVALLSRFR